ncbi:HAMP domain-containing sensor histidine kinase [Hydrogenophaga sp. 5NK40-0174]|uniref:sensor histidine kinase n=1 Tax=Hydrogenophaga sp. 5NK40-0174 TaxID=3127649 RepID=UPI003105BD32
MKLGPLDLPSLPAPRLRLAAFRRRLVFHGAFLLLAAATVVLAVTLLAEERQRSRDRYEAAFRQRLNNMSAQLRHPTGQLALLNADAPFSVDDGISPVVLPFAGLDFGDPFKARQAVEMSGCAVQWPDGQQLCVAVGRRAYAGAFVYAVADLMLPPAVARTRGQTDLAHVSRARIDVTLEGEHMQWMAPFEAGRGVRFDETSRGIRGRLTGFAADSDTLDRLARPERDFGGWLWQDSVCADPNASLPACDRRSLVSVRLPVDAWRDQVYRSRGKQWPPENLYAMRVRLRWMGTAGAPDDVIFDSQNTDALRPFALAQLGEALLKGEQLRIDRLVGERAQTISTIGAPEAPTESASRWIRRLVRRLPLDEGRPTDNALRAEEEVITPAGRYALSLSGDLGTVDEQVSASATRMSGYVGAMLAAIALTWLLIEVGLMRRITSLTRRAAALRYNMQDPQVDRRLGALDVSDLGGRDELGILANTLATLLERVKEGVRREHIRAEQERDMWHAVGHEIMSPLQSLMVLHGDASDPSHRYVQRMQQAVRVLYGTASPSDAISAAPLELQALDLAAFLSSVANHAPDAGIGQVVYEGPGEGVWVTADEHSLEDVIAHVLRNADRYRHQDTLIHIGLGTDGKLASVMIRNQGPAIAEEQLDRIFEYGVSDQNAAAFSAQASAAAERRGQGLYVARTYLAKMGGSIRAENRDDGVQFCLELPLRPPARE